MEIFLLLILSIAVIVILVRLSGLSARLDDSALEIKWLKGRLDQLEVPPTPPPAENREVPLPQSPTPITEMPTQIALPPPAIPTNALAPAFEPLPPPPPRAPSKTKEEWEALIGGRLLNRIGAIALIIGVGFFLKYAFDKNWINEWVRVLIGVAIGGALLAGAARSHGRGLAIFAQGLVGAGISILYLSGYASFNYYALVSQPVAFFLMGVVTVVAFLQAFRYDSLAVSLLGWLGGFLTPFLLSTGETNAPGLFTYIALLDAGILAVLLLKPRWIILEPLTLAATYTVYFLWYGDAFGEHHLAVAVFFLCVFWLLFHGLDTARALLTSERTTVLHRLLGGTNAFAFAIGMYLVIDPRHHLWSGSLAAMLAALYAGSAVLIARRRTDRTVEVMQNAITAVVLLVLAAEIHFEDLVVIPVYALEVAALAWIGLRRDLRYVWIASLAVLAWAVAVLLVTPGALVWREPSTFTLLLNRRAGAFLALIAATAAVVLAARRAPRRMTPQLAPLLHSTWIFLVFLLLTTEINDLFRSMLVAAEGTAEAGLRFQQGLAITAAWATLAIPLTWCGEIMDIRPVRLAGIIVACLAVLQGIVVDAAYAPIEQFVPVLNPRAAVFALIGGTTLWQALWLSRKDRFAFGQWIHLPWILAWFVCCTVETIDWFRHAIFLAPDDARDELVFLRLMTLAGVWTLASVPLIWTGARSGRRILLDAGFLFAALGTALALVRGFAYDPVTAFIPVVNARAAVLLVVIAVLAWSMVVTRRGAPPHPWVDEIVLAVRLLIIAATLVLITGEIRDTFEREIALLPEDTTGEAHHLINLEQMLLSSAWLVYSILLMGYGLWRRTRVLRIAAIVLFAVAILKIFIYDLSFLDTVYRIVSFIGLGVILLSVSYLYQRYRGLLFDSTS
jgi:uncharacterized membrane protein